MLRRRAKDAPLISADRAARLRAETVAAARRARRAVLVLAPAFAGVLLFHAHRRDLLGKELYHDIRGPVQAITVLVLVGLGWALARDLGRAIGPQLLGRLDPGTAGTVGFLIRLLGIVAAILLALRVAGLPQQTVAVGGAATAVIVGLAAQQTLGNLFAGMVLLSARPFRVGDRVKLQGGGIAGTLEGVVDQLGLLYVVLSSGDDQIMVPNATLLQIAVIPLREPDGVDFVARLRQGVRPSDLQAQITDRVTVGTRGRPHIDLIELDDDEVVVRVTATPVDEADGWRLADEVLAAVEQFTRDELTVEHIVGQRDRTTGQRPTARQRAEPQPVRERAAPGEPVQRS